MKKLIIIMLILILLLGGGGGGAYYYLYVMNAPEENVVEEAPLPPPPEFEEMDSISIPVIRNGRVMKFVLLKTALELVDSDAREKVERYRPRLKDAYLRELHDYFSTVPVDKPINVRAVTARLMRASRHVLGRGVVTDILIQGVYEKKNF
ncbi:hypothetical protein [Aestuariispira insulae]|uniref:Flagellar FliL protein n=1 Tax=Aestuariispira insulae TaxID=1461337 RepID=A0A3D9HVA6_9PROT|nr:hypothetical protein [Aestuariispira insulae]RED53370.1 flagellar FliL protein [Aestuariispira insulae]